MTGSFMISKEIGQRKNGGISISSMIQVKQLQIWTLKNDK